MKINANCFANKNLLKERNDWEIEEEDIVKSLALALKVLRKYKKYSLKLVSEGTGIPFPTIARYENGENVPSVIQAYKLACFYGFSLNDMFLLGLTENIEEYYTEILDNWKE